MHAQRGRVVTSECRYIATIVVGVRNNAGSSHSRDAVRSRPPDDHSVPRPLQAAHHRPPPAEEPDHEHVPRSGLRRGRYAEGALLPLPRGEGQGRARAVDVRRFLDDLDRLAAAVRADQPRRGSRHSVAAIVLRRRPPPRLRHDDPDHPHGAAHRLELARLAPDHRAVRGARARAPFVSEGHGPGTTSTASSATSRPPPAARGKAGSTAASSRCSGTSADSSGRPR